MIFYLALNDHPTELIPKATYMTAKMYTEATMQVTMKSTIFLPYEWWNVITGIQITDKTRVRVVWVFSYHSAGNRDRNPNPHLPSCSMLEGRRRRPRALNT